MKVRKTISALAAAAMLLTCAPNAAVLAATDDNAQPQPAAEQAVQNEQAADQTVRPETPEVQAAADLLPYQDTSLSFEERAADLVSRMTLEEKAAQTAAKGTPAISRLGVSKYDYWNEGIHGVARLGVATSFPSSLAMSNTWDTALMQTSMDIMSTEARGKNPRYDLNYWNPTINMARDPRWGRNEESYGEDPFLTAQIGGAAVRGMQGDDEKYLKVIATIKHYAANNCEGERQTGTSIMNERTMREYYSRAFRDIVMSSDPGAVMSSYNGTTLYRNGEILTSMDGQKIDYIASSANSYLLSDVLKRAYGFGGFIVGDCGAWDNAYGRAPLKQKLYPDMNIEDITAAMTVSKIIKAGSSLDCGGDGNGTAQLVAAVNAGLISEDDLDLALYNVFLQRMRTGEFDNGAKYQDIKSDVIETDEHVAVAEKAAEESWVLLKNDGALPFNDSSKALNIAIVGDKADDVVLGDYSGEPTKTINPLDGITQAVKQINPNSTVQLIGSVSGTTPLFNIKSITLKRSSGGDLKLDLSTAKNTVGMSKGEDGLMNITSNGVAVIPSVNFANVTDVLIEAASMPGMPKVTVTVGYGSINQAVASVQIQNTANADTYAVNSGVYNGATGGYTETRDMYIKIDASADFSIDNYRGALETADYIIAYGGTTEADSSESNDRASIDLPTTQSHVQQICDEFPAKTIVVLQTVGQINVEGFKDKCAAMLWTSYNGQRQGEALGKVLTGAVNPSGKLTTTWYTKADLDKMPIGSPRTNVDGVDYNFTSYELAYDINNPEAQYPGRTYQYYSGTPVYPFGYGESYTTFEYSNVKIDKASADANDTVTITADVKNTGSAAGTEVAQLYITVPGADGKTLPLKQLKGFERVTLDPGETKTATFSLDLSDVFFFDEANQQNYVIPGEYTAKVGGSSADAESHTVKFSVSGTIAETVKSVYAIPSGLKVYSVNNGADAANTVSANASVTLKNDKVITDFAANGITVTYSSNNPEVANVDAAGNVTAGAKEGTATITVKASKEDGSSAEYSFPVVSLYREGIDPAKKAEYLARLDAVYAECPKIAYTSENWAELEGIYTDFRSTLETALIDDGLETALNETIAAMQAVPKIELTEAYTVRSADSNIISGGEINYNADGIGVITATATSITGAINESNPAKFAMEAISEGSAVSSDLVWSIERLDGSSRKNAEINLTTGEVTLYTNGIYKITASDYPNEKCGSVIVYANLQIEGENADDDAGANLNDEKAGASGGKDAGSTKASWLRFDGVKLDRLTGIKFRVSKDSGDSDINVSLLPNSNWTIASVKAQATGAWTNWAEVTAEINRYELSKMSLDENGCGTIYVQTNSANLDYISLEYNYEDIDPVSIGNGTIAVNTNLESGILIGAGYDSANALTNTSTANITDKGKYLLNGFKDGSKVSIFGWNNIDTMQPMTGKKDTVYTAPEMKDIYVYNFSDSIYDRFFVISEGVTAESALGMSCDGGWASDKGITYKHTNGVTYTFTRSLKGGKGQAGARRVYFTPDSDGVVTAVFAASDTRQMYIEQDGKSVTEFGINDNTATAVQMNVKAGIPVYVYGGGSNKKLFGVLFEPGATAIEATPSPVPTATPTPAPLPDTNFDSLIEFEDYAKSWNSSGKTAGTEKASNTASGGKIIDTTAGGDIFYFGDQTMDNLKVIDLYSATRNDAGNASAEFFAVDTAGIDVASADRATIDKLLTPENSLGSVNIIQGKNWDTYNDLQFAIKQGFSGTKGLFVKLTSDGKYAGNHDCITLKYNLGGTTASVGEPLSQNVLSAENETAKIEIDGSLVTLTKNDGTTEKIDYNELNGKDVTFIKVVDWNGTFTALAHNNNSGKNEIIGGKSLNIWGNHTPVSYAEKDEGAPSSPVINDIVSAGDQLYAGCDGGYMITMTPCSKCTTIKKVCDFDIKELGSDGETLYLSGNGETAEIAIADARQESIKGDAAKELIAAGAVAVDVRSPEEYAEDSIDGSVNVPVDEFGQWLDTQDKDETIIVYCASGRRAAQAAEIAKEQGFNNIYNAGSIDELK